MKKRIRIQGMLIFLAVAVTILLSRFVLHRWKKESLDEFLDVLGIALVLFGFMFRIAARGYKEEKSSQGKNLVQDGPYRLMRHPMYFGTLLIGIGIVVTLFELWVLSLFLIVYFLIYLPQIKKEDKMLLKRFGQEYKNYCEATPKYFPKVHYLLSLKKYIPLKLPWLKKEFFSLIMVTTAMVAFEAWEDVKYFGHKEFLKEPLELFLIILSFLIIIILFRKKESYDKR